MFGNYFAEKNLMSGSGSSSYSYERLESDIAKNKVKSIEVVQNAQVPTGSAIVKLNDGEKKVAHVTDVNKVIDLAQQYKVSCQVDDVKSSDAGWLSMILPWIVIGVIMMFMFGMISRASGGGGGHDEREQTLNQLLVEMDGFGVNEGIIVMAATNRVDILDPAILRPGRFDRKVAVGRPDVKGREEILKVHVKGKPLAEDVDLHQIARTTPGFSGADLENLMNEAAIHAARNNARFIRMEDIRKSFIKVGIGTEKKSRLVPELERKITAYHEAGHAILFHLLPDVGPVYTVSIIPTGMGAAGYTMPVPENDNVFETKGRMIQEIKVGMGGRIAEELIFDDVTTGASQDIKQVTDTARSMITKFGMSDRLGFINYEENTDEVFLGRDLGHSRSFSEEVASIIDKEVKKLVDDCYTDAKRILTENMDVLHSCANLLLEKERISREEFEALFKNDKAAEENL